MTIAKNTISNVTVIDSTGWCVRDQFLQQSNKDYLKFSGILIPILVQNITFDLSKYLCTTQTPSSLNSKSVIGDI